jgi:drug/metabolite transporter (DMT)-like permease
MKNSWIFLAFLSTIITALGTIGLKFIDNSKYNNNLFLALTFIAMGIITFCYMFFNSDAKNILIKNCDISLIFFVILYAVILILTYLVMQYAFKISPNIGYSHIIINLNVIITVIASYYLFKQKLDLRCLIGIIISLIGISIIAYYSNKK